MPFNASEFTRAKYESRTADVRLSGISHYFDDGDDPTFKVRGLTYSELAAADQAVEKSRAVDVMARAISVEDSAVNAVREILGIHSGHPEQMVRRIHFLVSGSVEPKFTESMAVQLSERHPVEFLELTNKVIELTGLGRVPVKK